MTDTPSTAAAPTRWDHRRTDRLVLDHAHEDDIQEWHEIHADPEVWTHFPSGRHRSLNDTERLVHASISDWNADGLGYWSIRTQPGGPIIGCGGCRAVAERGRWNLYYRFAPTSHGNGYATELAHAAVAAANDVDPDQAVVAYMLEHNTASWRVAERIGLVRVWEGRDEGNPDPDAISVAYADRPDVAI